MWGPGLLYFCTSSTRCSQTCLDAEVAPQCTPTAPCSALHTSTTQVCTSIALHSTLQFNQTDCSAIRSYDWVQCNAVLVQFSSIWPANAATSKVQCWRSGQKLHHIAGAGSTWTKPISTLCHIYAFQKHKFYLYFLARLFLL